jgi:hypothetical protein
VITSEVIVRITKEQPDGTEVSTEFGLDPSVRFEDVLAEAMDPKLKHPRENLLLWSQARGYRAALESL